MGGIVYELLTYFMTEFMHPLKTDVECTKNVQILH